MHYTIYFHEKPLVLSDGKTPVVEKLLKQPGNRFQNQLSDGAIDDMIKEIQEEKTTSAVFLHTPVEKLLQGFKEKMRVIQAGGGLVHTGSEKVLLIFRRGKWDLPKGKVDEGETVAAASLREVEEETGLQNLQLEGPLTVTYHTYYQDGVLILKESHWYLMKTNEQQTLVPQTNEDIEQCLWVQFNELASYLENTHPSIIDVLELGAKKLGFTKEY